MKSLLASLFIAATGVTSLAQAPVTLQHAGNTFVFYTSSGFQDAYNAAVDGDTIHLPGGHYSSLTVDKQITIIGTGHFPDSTLVTGHTQINGTMYFGSNADNAHFEGLYITGNLQANAADVTADYFTIHRCLIDGDFSLSGSRITPTLYLLISECVIRGNIDLSNTTQAVLRNNIFQSRIHYAYQSLFENNNFINSPYYSGGWHNSLYDCDYNLIRNNIFAHQVQLQFIYCQNSVIENNVFTTGTYDFGTNSSASNYFSAPASTLFINWTSGSFLHSDNFHLTSSVTYPGNDATECGIYGGAAPWKEGGVPVNPHFIQASIDSQTNSSGEVNVIIKAGAQQR